MRRDFGHFPVCIIKAGFKLYQFHTVINVIPLLPLITEVILFLFEAQHPWTHQQGQT